MIDSETERLMLNWVEWTSGPPIGLSMTSAYSLEGRGRRAEVSMPLLNGEAMDVDNAVSALPELLHQVINEYWLRREREPIHRKARRCQCALRTFYERLERAHASIRAYMTQRRTNSERMRAALSTSILKTAYENRTLPV